MHRITGPCDNEQYQDYSLLRCNGITYPKIITLIKNDFPSTAHVKLIIRI